MAVYERKKTKKKGLSSKIDRWGDKPATRKGKKKNVKSPFQLRLEGSSTSGTGKKDEQNLS